MTGSSFLAELARAGSDSTNRRWIYVPYDQLSDRIGPLAVEDPDEVGIVIVESPAKAARRPYHKQKLALVLASQRQFAIEQARRGVAVRHVVDERGFAPALEDLAQELGPMRVMQPAERELRVELADLVRGGALELLPHEGWLTTPTDFAASHPEGAPWRMDAFYRHVRRTTGILMQDGKPIGGRFSFDTENRKPWRGEPAAPEVPRFRVDPVTAEVCELVEARFGAHPGDLDAAAIPASASQVERLWDWAKRECLASFGPFQDAMSVRSSSLFHTRISALLHLHRLLPRRVVDEVAALDLPIASREGFVRQVLGWREYVRHVHEATDGLRRSPTGERWDGAPSMLGAERPLPPAFWGRASGLDCLDHVVASVWREGYGHHITRLMVLSNIAQLLEVSPRELTDWFWVAYVDAFDWVVEPNVLGMGTFAVGDAMTTKPYVAGSAYVHRMGDFCGECAFDPKVDCPLRELYWAFLARHESALRDNPRLRMPFASLRKRGADQRRRDAEAFERVAAALARGESLSPD
ncbi:MAG: cryptochrome/photolyase family protein [Planctomycetes bacterium]|nr:cryptochrome/photolyase family protein [Planctomycetota bacterium]